MSITVINRGQIEREIQNAIQHGGVKRLVQRGGCVQWLGQTYFHKRLTNLYGAQVLIKPSKKHPETKIKVFLGSVQICKIKLKKAKVIRFQVTELKWSVPNTPQARFMEWQRLSQSDVVPQEAEKWLQVYQKSAEFSILNESVA